MFKRIGTPIGPVDAAQRLRAALRSAVNGGRLQDLLLAALALAIISLMVLPLPAAVLDALIAVNIGLSVLLMMLALYVRSPLALSTFPTLLLLTTLLRLSLNIASTRSILLHANAGQIIDTFGRLVVGGNVVVGLVVFSIIAIVQFVVIAKGAERIAEVGARFTLDALPGKQMSVEAELRAGLIDVATSQARRAELQKESHLYGAMDGAMKFVKGDAIAGLLIALVNIVAGISVGVALHGLAFGESVSTYTVLTVGDGLVSQIPSLFVSMAAGLLITRVAAAEEPGPNQRPRANPATANGEPPNLAREIGGQLTGQPKALLVTGAVLFACLWVPGFPKWQFLGWAALFILGGLALQRSLARRALAERQWRSRQTPRDGPARAGNDFPSADAPAATVPLAIVLSPGFEAALNDGRLAAEVERARAAVTQRLGIPFPGAQLRCDSALAHGHFRIEFNEVPEQLLAGDVSQVGAALVRTLRARAADLLGLQEVRELLGNAQRSDPELVAEVLRVVPLGKTLQVLRRLVGEDVPIRNLRAILHALLEWAPREKDPVALTEHARNALAGHLTWQFGGEERQIHAIDLAPELETLVRAAIRSTPAGSYLALEAPRQAAIAAAALQLSVAGAARAQGQPVCLLAAMDIRRHVRRLLEPFAPDLAVLSFQDLSEDARIVSLGTIPA